MFEEWSKNLNPLKWVQDVSNKQDALCSKIRKWKYKKIYTVIYNV